MPGTASVVGNRSGRHRGLGLAAALAAALLLTLGGCGGGGSGITDPGDIEVPPPAILTLALPDGVMGVEYRANLSGISVLTLTWSVTTGNLPGGLSLNASNGQITGTPTATGAFTFTIQLADDRNQTDTQEFTIGIGDPADPRVERVSLANDGSEANSDSGNPALNEDGRFVAFTSFADNLVAGDTNGATDVFLRDRTCATTVRVSVAGDGTQGDGQSFSPALSAVNAGTLFVAYASDASNLVPGDDNAQRDVFVTAVDVSSCSAAVQSTVRASVATDGTQGDAFSQLPSISENGLVVSYTSNAATLAPADNNLVGDAFVTNLSFAGGTLAVVQTRRVSLAEASLAVGIPPTQAETNLISDTTIGNSTLTMVDNEHVGRTAFISAGTGINQFREIIANDATTLTVDPPWDEAADGTPLLNDTSLFRILALEEFDAETFSDTTIGNSTLTMVDDENINAVIEITLGPGAGQQRRVTDNDETTFTIDPAWTDLPDISSRFRLLFQGTAASARPRLSADGALVVFDSSSQFEREDSNNTTDVYLHDLTANQTARASLGPGGALGNGASDGGSLDADGNLLLFRSLANVFEIVLPPTQADIFSATTIGNSGISPPLDDPSRDPPVFAGHRVEIVEGTGEELTRAITEIAGNTLTVDPAWDPVPDDTSVFRILGDTNGAADLFVRDLNVGDLSRVTLATDGSEANAGSDLDARMSRGGQLVVFATAADNLATDDRNAARDVFLRDRQAGETNRVSVALGGTNPNREAIDPAISSNGSTVAFASTADNLVADDTNSARDVFLMTTGITDMAPTPAPVIAATQLRTARRGVGYSAELKATGGARPLLWVVTAGQLPPGLFLDAASGRLTGAPQRADRYRFTVTVLDSSRPLRRAQRTLTLVVSD